MSQKRGKRDSGSPAGECSMWACESNCATFELRDGNVGVLTVESDDGEVRLSEVRTVLQEVVEAAPTVVVLAGSERQFVLGERSGSDRVDANSPTGVDGRHPYSALPSLDCPVIAALRGQVVDGGFTLALQADIRISSHAATYGLPGVTEASTCGEYALEQLVPTVGRARARELISSTETYDAATVADWGLVNEVVPADDVLARALAVAETFTHRSSIAYRYIKRAVDAASSPSERRDEIDSGAVGRTDPTGHSATTGADAGRSPPYDTLELDEPRDGIHRITLDRRQRLNALTGQMVEELVHALDWLPAREPDAVVVEGAGRRAFSVGLDPRAEVCRSGTPADGEAIARKAQRATDRLASIDAPTVAGISGYALGGGLEVALAVDARVGGASSTYGLPEITHGLVPAAGGTQRLPEIVGRGRAMQMLFTGEHFDAGTIADWGLLTEVVADDRVTTETLDLAEDLAGTDGPHRNVDVEVTPTIEGFLFERAGNRHGFARGPFDGESLRG